MYGREVAGQTQPWGGKAIKNQKIKVHIYTSKLCWLYIGVNPRGSMGAWSSKLSSQQERAPTRMGNSPCTGGNPGLPAWKKWLQISEWGPISTQQVDLGSKTGQKPTSTC